MRLMGDEFGVGRVWLGEGSGCCWMIYDACIWIDLQLVCSVLICRGAVCKLELL